MKTRFFTTQLCVFVALFAAITAPAHAEASFDEGWWRVELFAAPGVASGSSSRSGEVMINGTVEYEFPLAERTTLGLRLLPLFVYTQDDDSKHFLGIKYDEAEDDTVWGAGFGLALRFYAQRNEYQGFYGEIEGHLLGHANEFEGNNSNINFLTGAGVGYAFENDLSIFVKFNHISNAGLGSQNAGVNTVGLGLGYKF